MTDMTMTPRSLGNTDAPHLSPATPAEDARTILLNEISWGAVFAGVSVALVLQILLNLFGVGIGAATLNPLTGDNPSATTFSITAGLWWTASGVLASLAGGLTAGRLAGKPVESTAGWHGLIAWAMTTIIIFYLLTTAIGGIVGGVFSTVGGALGGAGRTVATAAQSAAPALTRNADPFAAIESSMRETTGGTDPAALRDASVAAFRGMVMGDPAKAQEAREQAAQALSRAQGVPVEEARTRVGQYEQQYRQSVDEAKRQAAQAAEITAKSVSRGSLFAVIALALGAMAGWFGGRRGAVDPTLTVAHLDARR